MNDAERYWSVDLPGLTEEVAEQLAGSNFPGVVGASAIDPRIFLTLNLDVESVRPLTDFLRSHERGDVLDGILQELESWLGFYGRHDST